MWYSRCKYFLKHTFITLGVLATIGVLGALIVIYSGVFNIAATEIDSPPLNWLLVTVREESIKLHARNIQVPQLTGVTHRDNGFRIYRNECVMCHTPVGRTAEPMAIGFNPQAPSFGANSDNMSPSELFWVTKNGIRFTGMPAWGPSRSDQEIWDIVAFLMTLPKMSAAEYNALDNRIPLETPSKK